MKQNIPIILSAFSAIGLAILLLSDFYGGIFIWFLSYPIPFTITILLYITSALILVVKLLIKGIKPNKQNVVIHASLWVYISIIYLIQSELLKSERILSATLHDDQYDYELVLRKNGKCETNCNGIFGYYQTIKGEYKLSGDTIKFIKIPYDNQNFITQKLLIVRDSNLVFMQTGDGGFPIKKEFLNYFKINEIKIP